MALTGGVHMTPHPPTHPPIQIVKKMLGEQFLRHTFEMTYVRCLTLALFQRFLKQNKCQTFLNIPQVLRNNNIGENGPSGEHVGRLGVATIKYLSTAHAPSSSYCCEPNICWLVTFITFETKVNNLSWR
jgi:hypothetical protein